MNRAALGLSLLAACSPAGQAAISGPAPDATSGPQNEGEGSGVAADTTTTTVTIASAIVPQSASVFTLPEDAPPVDDDEWWDRERILGCIRDHEQGADGYATETGNGYSSAYQFDQPTFDGAAERAGYPEWVGRRASQAPPHVQDDIAWQLYRERGLQPWPTPQAMC